MSHDDIHQLLRPASDIVNERRQDRNLAVAEWIRGGQTARHPACFSGGFFFTDSTTPQSCTWADGTLGAETNLDFEHASDVQNVYEYVNRHKGDARIGFGFIETLSPSMDIRVSGVILFGNFTWEQRQFEPILRGLTMNRVSGLHIINTNIEANLNWEELDSFQELTITGNSLITFNNEPMTRLMNTKNLTLDEGYFSSPVIEMSRVNFGDSGEMQIVCGLHPEERYWIFPAAVNERLSSRLLLSANGAKRCITDANGVESCTLCPFETQAPTTLAPTTSPTTCAPTTSPTVAPTPAPPCGLNVMFLLDNSFYLWAIHEDHSAWHGLREFAANLVMKLPNDSHVGVLRVDSHITTLKALDVNEEFDRDEVAQLIRGHQGNPNGARILKSAMVAAQNAFASQGVLNSENWNTVFLLTSGPPLGVTHHNPQHMVVMCQRPVMQFMQVVVFYFGWNRWDDEGNVRRLRRLRCLPRLNGLIDQNYCIVNVDSSVGFQEEHPECLQENKMFLMDIDSFQELSDRVPDIDAYWNYSCNDTATGDMSRQGDQDRVHVSVENHNTLAAMIVGIVLSLLVVLCCVVYYMHKRRQEQFKYTPMKYEEFDDEASNSGTDSSDD